MNIWIAFFTSWTLILVPQTKVGVASSISSPPSEEGIEKSSVEEGVAATAGDVDVAGPGRRPRLVERAGVGVDAELAKREGFGGGVPAADEGVEA